VTAGRQRVGEPYSATPTVPLSGSLLVALPKLSGGLASRWANPRGCVSWTTTRKATHVPALIVLLLTFLGYLCANECRTVNVKLLARIACLGTNGL
jgi:hypothetical protein